MPSSTLSASASDPFTPSSSQTSPHTSSYSPQSSSSSLPVSSSASSSSISQTSQPTAGGSQASKANSTPTAAIVGGAIGGAAVLSLMIGIALVLLKHRRRDPDLHKGVQYMSVVPSELDSPSPGVSPFELDVDPMRHELDTPTRSIRTPHRPRSLLKAHSRFSGIHF